MGMYALDIYIIYVYLTSCRFHNLAATPNGLHWQENNGFTHNFAKNGKQVKIPSNQIDFIIDALFQLLAGYNIFLKNKCWIRYIHVIHNKIVIYIINVFELVKMQGLLFN